MSKIGKIVGSISPLYGGLTGQGLMGAALSPALHQQLKDEEMAAPVKRKRRYSAGGKVRGDGCAMKGKTKGKMR